MVANADATDEDAGANAKLAYWEFANRIITPIVGRRLPEPGNAHAVEIGFGDGRLLCPASWFFQRVTGVATDAQDDVESARQELITCGATAELLTTESYERLPLPDASVEFVYSMHGVVRLSDLAAFQSLASEVSRVLVPGGGAMLWFGRLSRLPFAPPGKSWWRGWERRPSPNEPDRQRLHLRMFHARRAVMRAGMKAVALSTPLHPDNSWRLLRGGDMSYVTAWKPG